MELTGRAIEQKAVGRKNQKLRDSAKECPHCMGCGLQNHDGNMLCLAHSNRLSDGKGRGMKSVDRNAAILCQRCHDFVDGRTGSASRAEMQAYHYDAHCKTYAWWLKKGLVP